MVIHCNSELRLVVVQKGGVGDDDEGDLKTQRLEDGTRTCCIDQLCIASL